MITFRFLLIITLCVLCSSCKDQEQPVQPKQETEVIEPTHSKGPKATRDERMSWQKPDLIIEALGDISDKTIADIGAGIGYFTFKLLPKSKKIIAVDIDQEMIDVLESFKNSLPEKSRSKLDIRLAEPQDPKLAENEVDIVLIVNTVAYIQPRVEYFKNLKKKMTRDGKIIIVDFKNKRLPEYTIAPDFSSRVYMHVLEDQLEEAGFYMVETDDTTLEYQYIISAQ